MREKLRYYAGVARVMLKMSRAVHFSVGGWTVALFYLGYVLTFGTQMLTVWLMMTAFPSLGGFSLWEVLIIYALDMACYGCGGLGMARFFDLYEYQKSGQFDAALLKPSNPLLYTMLTEVHFGYLFYIVFGLSVVLFSLTQLAIPLSPEKLAVALVTVIVGGCIYFCLMAIASMATFWLGRSNALLQLLLSPFRNIMKYPLHIYPGVIRVFFTVVIPYAFVGYYPALVLLNRTEHPMAWMVGAAGVAVVLAVVCKLVWNAGLKRYESIGG